MRYPDAVPDNLVQRQTAPYLARHFGVATLSSLPLTEDGSHRTLLSSQTGSSTAEVWLLHSSSGPCDPCGIPLAPPTRVSSRAKRGCDCERLHTFQLPIPRPLMTKPLVDFGLLGVLWLAFFFGWTLASNDPAYRFGRTEDAGPSGARRLGISLLGGNDCLCDAGRFSFHRSPKP